MSLKKEDTCLGNMNKTNVLVSMGQRMQVKFRFIKTFYKNLSKGFLN